MKIKDILIAIANKTSLQRKDDSGWGWYSIPHSEILKEFVSCLSFTYDDVDVDLPSFRIKPQEVNIDGVVYELPTQKTLGEAELYTVKVGLKSALAQRIPSPATDQIGYVKESSNYFTTLEDAQLVADLFNSTLKETTQ